MAIGKGWTYVVKGPHGRGCSDGLDVEAGKGMQRALTSLETVTLSHSVTPLGWGVDVGRQEAFVMEEVSSFGALVAPKSGGTG